MKKKYDYIVEVEDTGSVKKFNPFHDARGRFASSNGFASYSANPNTKAGAMAIARSAAAGHGNTLNVHRESYGENIRQNANWLGRGKQANPRQQGNATLRQRVEPVAGLPGASATGASWQAQNAAQGRTTNPSKKPAQQQQKPAQQQANPKNTQQPKQQTQATSSNKMVDGKDMWEHATFAEKRALKQATTSEILKKQGMDGPPSTVQSYNDIKKLAKANGNLMIRTVNSDDETQAQARFGQFKHGSFYIAEGDNNRFGNGLYVAEMTKKNGVNAKQAFSDSVAYGNGRTSDKVMFMTIDKSAKRITYPELERMARNEGMTLAGWSGKNMATGDIASYAAAKGYDVIESGSRLGGAKTYSVVLNRSKLTVCEMLLDRATYSTAMPKELERLTL